MHWSNAEQIVQAVKHELDFNDHGWGEQQAVRVLLHEISQLKWAKAEGQLELALSRPETSIDQRWDTLIATAIRYQLRKDEALPEELPTWLKKKPLEKMWWPLAKTPRRASNAFNTSPPELRQAGIFLMRESFK